MSRIAVRFFKTDGKAARPRLDSGSGDFVQTTTAKSSFFACACAIARLRTSLHIATLPSLMSVRSTVLLALETLFSSCLVELRHIDWQGPS